MVDKANKLNSEFSLSLGKSLAVKRKQLGWTQANVAEKLDLDTETISRFERGVSVPSLITLQKLAITLKTTISELLEESSSEPTEQAATIAIWLTKLTEKDRLFLMQLIRQSCEHFGLPD